MAPKDLVATLVEHFVTTGGKAASEVVSFDAATDRYFVTNGAEDRIDVFATGGLIVGSIDLTGLPNYGGVNSVAAKNGVVAVAVEGAPVFGVPQKGAIAIFDAATLEPLNYVPAGYLPDMVTFSPDGSEIYVANEGEPYGAFDAPGSVSLIAFPSGFDGFAQAQEVFFSGFDGQEDALRAAGVRIFPGKTPGVDFEPEYIAVDSDTGDLFVTLQEANTVARIDRATLEVTLLPQGTTDHSQPGFGLDASDRDGTIDIANWPVNGLRMADAVAAYEIGGQTYYFTANEGDDRGENVRIGGRTLDPTVFPDAAALKQNANLGRLAVSSIDGDTDGDGDHDALFSYGSRSFTIYDETGAVVWDSGEQFETIIAGIAPERFNSDEPGDPDEAENRSDAKGPEPEAIAVGEVDGTVVAVIGLERDSGLMVFDVTDPTAPVFLEYIDGFAVGDVGPEVIAFIPAADSPTGNARIAVSYEISGTTSVYELSFDPAPAEPFTLELFHLADQEARFDAVVDAPNLSAVLAALKAQDLGADGIEDNTLFLSSGDAFIPGLFFEASAPVFGSRGIADILIQNELGIQAISFGNHEFDFGTAVLKGLIDGSAPGTDQNGDDFAGAAFPYLSGNLDFSTDANLAGLVNPDGASPQAGRIAGSTFFVVGGEKIGVVAATTPTLASISSPGGVGVSPSPFGSPPSAGELDALAAEIQADVDALLAANPDMNKVILLAHMQQISIEQELAARLSNVDIIVAGGSNTRLLDSDDRLRPGDETQGDYPIFIDDADGNPVAVVNTDGSYKYLGRLVIDFDADGVILPASYDPAVSGAYATDDQGVADLGAAGLIDPEIQAIAEAIKVQIESKEANVFGVADVYLNGNRGPGELDGVRTQETNLGNLTADANLHVANRIADALGETDDVVFSIKNGGGIRASIGQIVVPAGGTEFERLPNEEIAGVKPAGGISQNDIATALAFNNGLTLLTLTGEEIVALLEHGVAAYPSANGRFPQISGVKFSFDPDAPAGDRIVSAGIFAENGALIAELVRNGDLGAGAAEEFRIVTLGFLADPRFDGAGNFIGGGDGYPFPNLNTDPSVGEVGDAAVIARVNRVDIAEDDAAPRTGAATFAPDGSEQDALAEYLAANFNTTGYAEEDLPPSGDERIQNLDFRVDTVFPGPATHPVINEFVVNHAGTDTNEYVEVRGEANEDLSALTLIGIEGDGAGAGVIDNVVAVGTANAAGYWTTGYLANAFENGTLTLLLVEGFTGTAGQDLDTDDDGVLDVTPWTAVIDGVGLNDGGSGDRTYAEVELAAGFDGQSFAPGGASRIPDGVDTDTAADWVRNDFDQVGEGATSAGPDAGRNTPGAENALIGDLPPPPLTLISAIQGAGSESPLAGQRVTVEAVVTQLSGALRGFWVQEETADEDGDAATSEGVFVFTNQTTQPVAVGDLVRFEANVSEFFTLTQLSGLSDLQVLSSGAALPAATVIELPLAMGAVPAEVFEAVEGMQVSVVGASGAPLTVTDTFTRFGEVGVTAGAPLMQPTQVERSFSPEAEAVREANARNFILFENAVDDSLSGAPRVGDGIVGGAIDGAMHFTFGEFKVETDGAVAFDAAANPNPRQAAPDDVGGSLKVATLNVLNYFVTLGSRGAETAQELADQTAKLVDILAAMDADVVGLIEIENDLGATPDAATAALVDALNAEVGAGTYAYVATGRIGTDEIKQAFIYKTATVTPTGDYAVLDTAAFTDPLGTGGPLSRPALAQTFTEIASGESFTATVNHLKSKGSTTGGTFEGEPDDTAEEGSAGITRLLAARELSDWLATDPTGSGDPDHLILGDLNAYAMERAILALKDAGWTDLAAAFGANPFSYQFDGRLGTLDYAMANAAMFGQVTGATIWNANSLEAHSIQYDQIDFATFGDLSAFASSDHDPVIVGLDLVPERIEIVDGTGNDRLVGTDADELFSMVSGADVVVTGGGEDLVALGEKALNGRREITRIDDFDAARDQLDIGGVGVQSAIEGRGFVRLVLNGDLDVVLVRGVSSLADIAFSEEFHFAEPRTVADTAGNDVLRGTDLDEIFTLSGGRDIVYTGGGEDVADLSAMASNGRRDVASLMDFDTDLDMLDLGGATILSARASRGNLVLTLEEDRDVIVLRGVTDLADVTFADALMV